MPSQEFDNDPLIGSIRALKAEVNRWIDAELRARSDPALPRPALPPLAEAATTGDPRGRLDALAARLEGRIKQGRPTVIESRAGCSAGDPAGGSS